MSTSENTSSNKKETLRDKLSYYGGCLLEILIGVLLIVGLFVLTSKCEGKRSKENSERMASYRAYRDSVERVERERQELWAKEAKEHRTLYYESYNQRYHNFPTFENFDEWMDRANYAAVELLYVLYHPKEFEGNDGVEKMAEYLYYAPHEYEIECERCGETMLFIGFEEE